MLYNIAAFLLMVCSAMAQDISMQAEQVQKAGNMLDFAKNSLIYNTSIAKEEFGVVDAGAPVVKTVDRGEIDYDQKYDSVDFQDIFYMPKDSALVNQALDYFQSGKKMKVKARMFSTKKFERIVHPLIQVSSIMYNDETKWTVFSNLGKFTYTKPYIDDINITGISSAQVEFVIPIKDDMHEVIRAKRKEIDKMKRVKVKNHNIVVTLRNGECIFKTDVIITTKCASISEEIEKQVEI
ncbi:MAG: hypothetical protein ACI9CD_000500 [Candidatus Deianiraeaceae bacterium]|jgi:hypothetical protein